ncbi:hypothetical protein [Lentzea sp.]|uniref:hypothetical protein n=1 Tax=Lentzea sp. TaxID=56099 RepID=UPI0039C90F7D
MVSIPCRAWFAALELSYQDEALPPGVRARVTVEAASTRSSASPLSPRPHTTACATRSRRSVREVCSAAPRPPPAASATVLPEPRGFPTTEAPWPRATTTRSPNSPPQACRSGSTTCPASCCPGAGCRR